MKKTVHYVYPPIQPLVVGNRAIINTIDHPDLSNKQIDENNVAFTSNIVRIEPDGTFETQNTIYKPKQLLLG